MNIAFYAPFKSLDHPNPSGDLVIAKGLVQFLRKSGHTVEVASRLRARWIYFKPLRWFFVLAEFLRCLRRLKKNKPDVWLTYHTYYKSPDLLGPWVCRILGVPYVIFQGIYSTKRRRKLKTMPGFYLNRAALLGADHVFTNKLVDLTNLKRIIPKARLSYIQPGIYPETFCFDGVKRRETRKKWGVDRDCPVVLCACMFRDDVKTKGLSWMIQCFERLVKQQVRFHLVIAGTGTMEKELKTLAQKHIPENHTFIGKVDRSQMYGFYSSGELFAFPGIRESLGMVYLEAQSCGMPVVAFNNGGIPEVVDPEKTGFLIPMYDKDTFAHAVRTLIEKPDLRKSMGKKAAEYIRDRHDLGKNYQTFEEKLVQVVA